jgi:hypothetical protein
MSQLIDLDTTARDNRALVAIGLAGASGAAGATLATQPAMAQTATSAGITQIEADMTAVSNLATNVLIPLAIIVIGFTAAALIIKRFVYA